MRLYLIRHGETEYNKTGYVQGHSTVPLNATGIDQATRLGRRLAAEAEIRAGAAQHDHLGAVTAGRLEHAGEFGRHLVGDAVAVVRPVQRNPGRRAVTLATNGIGQSSSPCTVQTALRPTCLSPRFRCVILVATSRTDNGTGSHAPFIAASSVL